MACPSALSFILYNPLRLAFTDRSAILRESGIGEDSVVLEVGAGNGFFTEVIAHKAKKVYAVELQRGMVKKLEKRVSRFRDHVEITVGHINDITLPQESIDVAFLYYVFHEIDDQENAAKRIVQTVKPSGTISIYEPTIEVSRARMQETVRMFEDLGSEKESEKKSLFTRWAKLKKLTERSSY